MHCCNYIIGRKSIGAREASDTRYRSVDLFTVGGCQQTHSFGNSRSRAHTVAHSFAVQEAAIAGDRFQSVAHRVTEVQDPAKPVLAFIALNYVRFYRAAARDDMFELARIKLL